MAAECTPRSLVMLDEVGRGTSTHEGSALCAALLEWLDTRRITAVFATHLHEIDARLEKLGRPLPTLVRKCLPATTNALTGEIQMSFALSDGVCKSSHALHAARHAGVPAEIIARAQQLLDEDEDEYDDEPPIAPPIPTQISAGINVTEAALGALASLDGSSGADAAQRQLAAVSELLRAVSGRRELIHIPQDWAPPPQLRGRSCVYVLQRVAASGEPGALYVGESDAIDRRLKEHRHARKRTAKHAEALECVLVEVGSKSEALELEEQMIHRLKDVGLAHVLNVAHA